MEEEKLLNDAERQEVLEWLNETPTLEELLQELEGL